MERTAMQIMIDWIKEDVDIDSINNIGANNLKDILIHEKGRYLQKAMFLNRLDKQDLEETRKLLEILITIKVSPPSLTEEQLLAIYNTKKLLSIDSF